MTILDGLSPTGAWSFSRDLLTSWGGAPRYTEAGGTVSRLEDQSGNNRDFVQGTGSSQPALTTHGPASRECGDFDGSADHFTGASLSSLIAAGDGYMIVSFIADTITGTSTTLYNNHGLIGDLGGFAGLYIGGFGSLPKPAGAYNYDGNADFATIAGAADIDTPYVMEWLHESGNLSFRINGGSWQTVASGNTSNRGNQLRMGRGYLNSYFDGKIFEAATFSTVPSSGDRDTIAADFLAWVTGAGAFESDLILDYALSAAPVESSLTVDYALEGAPFESALTIDYRLSADGLFSNLEIDYRLLQFFESDITLRFALDEVFQADLSQLPVLVLTNENHTTRISQVPLLIVALPEQNTRVSQLTSVAIVHKKPVPMPGAIVPLAPIREVLSWSTVITQAASSKEQRSGLRDTPRYRLGFTIHIDDEEQRRDIYNLIYKLQGKEFDYPLYHAWSRVLASPESSGDRIYFDASHTEMRVGEKLAIFDVFTLETSLHDIVELHSDGATLAEPLDREVTALHVVCPVIPFRLLMPTTFAMTSQQGTARINMESTRPRAFRRVEDVTLPELGGLPILTRKPYGDAEENIDRNFDWLDNETSVPYPYTHWRYGLLNGRRDFVFDREEEADFWREFLHRAAGRRKVFRMPTFFDDLPLTEQPALSATLLTTSNIQAAEYLRAGSYGAVVLWRSTGPAYRQVIDHELNYNHLGDPISVTFKLATSIGSNTGDNVINGISFLNKVRLMADNVELEHHRNYSTISLGIQAVNE